ncbi:MAG: DUF1990 domain-containing protein [Polyangiaceae bacterium]
MWLLRRPSRERLAPLLAAASSAPLSYAEVGMSGRPSAPPGYGYEKHETLLRRPFAEAREALRVFATHRLPYMFLHPEHATVEEGLTVLVCARIGPLWTINPCRIVSVVDEPRRFSYAYGTLPGHSEHGEETFTVVEREDGSVHAETIACARPQDTLARLGKPVAHVVQRRIKQDYLAALAKNP